MSDLLGTSHSAHRNVGLQHRVQFFSLTLSDHLVGHGRLNHSRAHVVNTNAASCIFESRALGEPNHSMLSSMVGPASVAADKASKRGAVDARGIESPRRSSGELSPR